MIECSKPALDKLNKAGLLEKIIERKDIWHMPSLSVYLDDEEFYEVFNKAKNFFRNVDPFKENIEKVRLYKEVLYVERKVERNFFLDREAILINNPNVFAYLIFGEDILNYSDYGFESIKQLGESITSFCLGDTRHLFSKGHYGWMHEDYKNRLTNSYYGDFHIFQTDISGRRGIEQTLFGEQEVFDTMKDVTNVTRGIVAHYDYWDQFLAIILRYAEALGKKNIPEIVNWKDVLDEVGEVWTQTCEALGGDRFDDFWLSCPILVESQEIERLPLSITDSIKKTYIPYVKDRNLLFITGDEEGDIIFHNMGKYFENKRFRLELIYEENELIQLLKGTYRLFARDRSRMPKIIDLFLKGFPED